MSHWACVVEHLHSTHTSICSRLNAQHLDKRKKKTRKIVMSYRFKERFKKNYRVREQNCISKRWVPNSKYLNGIEFGFYRPVHFLTKSNLHFIKKKKEKFKLKWKSKTAVPVHYQILPDINSWRRRKNIAENFRDNLDDFNSRNAKYSFSDYFTIFHDGNISCRNVKWKVDIFCQ